MIRVAEHGQVRDRILVRDSLHYAWLMVDIAERELQNDPLQACENGSRDLRFIHLHRICVVGRFF